MNKQGQHVAGATRGGWDEKQPNSGNEAEHSEKRQAGRISQEVEKTKKQAEVAGGGSNNGSWAGSNEDLDQAERRSTDADS